MKKILNIVLIFILAIGIFIFLNKKDNTKDIQTINQYKKDILKEKNIISFEENIQNEQTIVRQRKTMKNISSKITINNFNKYLNYSNIDLLLKTYISTDDRELTNYIFNRFHEEINNPKVINKIIDLYNSSNNKKEKGRLSTLLFSIDTDKKLNIFVKKLDFTNKNMISDFISATRIINSPNSIKQLLVVTNNIDDINNYIGGVKIIYNNSDKTKIIQYLKNDIEKNGFYFTPIQEKIILIMLEGALEDQKINFIEKYQYDFSNNKIIDDFKNKFQKNRR